MALALVCIGFLFIIICALFLTILRFPSYHEDLAKPESETLEPTNVSASNGVENKYEEPSIESSGNDLRMDSPIDNEVSHGNILDKLTPTYLQAAQLYEAEQVLTKKCMNERGFEYIPNTADRESGKLDPVIQGDIEMAQTRGYGIQENILLEAIVGVDTMESVNGDAKPTGSSVLTPNANDLYLSQLSEEDKDKWHTALVGSINFENPSLSGNVMSVEDASSGYAVYWDADSCSSYARGELYESNVKLKENSILTLSLRDKYYEYVDENVAVKNAVSGWKGCMADNNLPNEYFGQTAELLSHQYYKGTLGLEELKVEEIRMASIDAACYKEHRLDDVLAIAEDVAQDRLRTENSEEIMALQNSLSTALANASKYR